MGVGDAVGEAKESRAPLSASWPGGVRAKLASPETRRNLLCQSHKQVCFASLLFGDAPFQEVRDGTFGMQARVGLSAAAWTRAH